MSDFACAIVGPVINLPVDNQPAADAGAHRHIEDNLVAASAAEPPFCERARIRIVFQRRPNLELRF